MRTINTGICLSPAAISAARAASIEHGVSVSRLLEIALVAYLRRRPSRTVATRVHRNRVS